MRPWSVRSNTLLPAPFAPRIPTRRVPRSVRLIPESATWSPRRTETLRASSGKTLPSAMAREAPFAHGERGGIDEEHEADEDDAEPEGERQVALARLERDRGGHDARDAVDVAADHHHRADFGSRAPAGGEGHGEERIAKVPQERADRAAQRDAHGQQRLAVF